MKVKNIGTTSMTMNCLNTGESITFEVDQEVTVGENTFNYVKDYYSVITDTGEYVKFQVVEE